MNTDKLMAKLNEDEIKWLNRVLRDKNDMMNAYQTEFYRCKCGRIREQGLRCVDENCTVDEDSD